ncbi:hypothetical protein [Cupriavidus necator]|uniref:hypothetical protein n=1 Tax=Cupriavidus necator TaxID=106590 RepID=UPI0005B4F9CF|nr:hypothetical protein [Cupriavidus necator]
MNALARGSGRPHHATTVIGLTFLLLRMSAGRLEGPGISFAQCLRCFMGGAIMGWDSLLNSRQEIHRKSLSLPL